LLDNKTCFHFVDITSKMSDLAPFVAAVIRDRVVAELKNENEALRRKNEALELTLHKRNPRRSIQITDSDGKKIFADNELDLEGIRQFGGNFSFFSCSATVRNQIPGHLWFRSRSWLNLELWIDGGVSARLQDLSFYYTSYKYVKFANADGEAWKYVATIEARDGDGLNLAIEIFLSPNDHAKLLNRERSVDFLPPAERENDGYNIEHSMDQEIPLSHLAELCREKDAVVFFDKWMCTEGWFLRHLMVPYVRY
jgi:hypothetical protein